MSLSSQSARVLANHSVKNLDQTELVELLRTGPVQFLVADPGLKLRWIPTPQRFEFWKTVQPQIAHPDKPICRAQFPNETAHIASQWRGRASAAGRQPGHSDLNSSEYSFCQGAGRPNQGKLHPGFGNKFVKCPQFVVPMVELVKVDVSPWNDIDL